VSGVRRGLTVALLLAALAAGCAAERGGTPTDTVGKVSHAAPDLEALLPNSVESVPLLKSSTLGARGNAFQRSIAASLRRLGKDPAELRFASGADYSNRISVEVGVFEAPGVRAAALERAIVRGSQVTQPAMRVSRATVAGKPVTTLLFPGSSRLYLYGKGDRVFYVGSVDPKQAAGILKRFP
jgi:hypothetical protein